MKEAGVTVVHCADSNQNVCSGVAPVRVMLNEGLKVALGSDIAGGDHLNMFDVVASAIRASKARHLMDNWETPFLTVPEGCVFLLGDNRTVSRDSRSSEVGPIAEKEICGIVRAVVFPFNAIRTVK